MEVSLLWKNISYSLSGRKTLLIGKKSDSNFIKYAAMVAYVLGKNSQGIINCDVY